MTETTLANFKPEDGHSFDDLELIDAFRQAADDAGEADNQMIHYVYLADGNMIGRVEVREETLTDGSKVCSLVLHPTPA